MLLDLANEWSSLVGKNPKLYLKKSKPIIDE
jgi:hypothetical protein